MMSLSCFQSCMWNDYIGDYHVANIIPPSTALAVVTKVSEKCKSTFSSAIQLKNH